MILGQGGTGAVSARVGRRHRGIFAVALVALVSPALMSVQPAEAAGSTSVNPGTVTPASAIAGGNSPSYTIVFTTSGSGALGAGGTITFVGPNGTAFSGCASSCGYTLAVTNGGSATVASAVVSSVAGPAESTVSPTTNQVVLTLGSSSSIAAGDQVTVTTPAVENPVTSGSYVMTESTSADTQPADSPSYKITAGQPTAVVATGGDNQTAPAGSKFPVALTATVADSHGNAVTNIPSTEKVSFTISSASGASATFANGTTNELDAVGTSGQSTTSIPAANGTTGGPYSVTATLVDTSSGSPVPVTGVSSGSFNLANAPAIVSPPHVTPSPVTLSNSTEAATGVTYNIPFKTSPSGALSGSSTITLIAPAGTSLPSCTTPCSTSTYRIAFTPSSAPDTAAISSVTASQSGGSSTNNKIVISLLVGSTIPAGSTVTITAFGVGNPTLAAAQDEITESTTPDNGATLSPAYAIVHGTAAKVLAVSGGGQSAQVDSQFPSLLVAQVDDSNNNPVGGVDVTFTVANPGGTAPSATFANNTNVEDDPTQANGRATTGLLTANQNAGGPYSVTASVSGVGSVSFTGPTGLTNTAAQVVNPTVSLSSDDAGAQNVTYTLGFSTSDSGTLPPSGGASCPSSDCDVTLIAPSGTAWPTNPTDYTFEAAGTPVTVQSVTVSGSPSNQVILELGGPVAKDAAVSLAIAGVNNPDKASNADQIQVWTFADNTPATTAFYKILPLAADTVVVAPANGGNNQSAAPGAPFALPLTAVVEDALGNPVPGVTVTFAAPNTAGNPTATFGSCEPGSSPSSCIETSNANGEATTAALTANSVIGGPYAITASVSGVNSTATFNLTNATVLTPQAITVSPDSAGASNAVYEVPFVTSAAGAIPSSGTCPGSNGTSCQVTLVAPNGTTLPATIGSYQVSVTNNHAATLTNVAVSTVQGPGSNQVSSTPNQAVFSFDASSIAAGDTVTVTISGATNPTVASTGYTFAESTSSDANAVGSPPFTIGAAAASAVSIAAGNPQSATIQTSYQPLMVQVVDTYGNPVPGETVTFTAPSTSGPSGTFATCPGTGSTASVCIVTTNSSGDAQSTALTADSTSGAFSVTVTATSANGPTLTGSTIPSFHLTNTPGGPQSLIITGGDSQTQTVGSQYNSVLQVQVLDGSNNPVPGVTVTFTAPSSGASVTIASGCNSGNPNPQTCAVTTDPNGVAKSSALSANDVAGSVSVTASLGTVHPQTFSLTNKAGTPATMTALANTSPQSATIGTAYGTNLGINVVDAYGNPVSGVTVTFTAPSSGASGTFGHCPGASSSLTTCVETTDATGTATSSNLTANALAGSYQAAAVVPGLPNLVFDLTNVHHGYWMVGSDGGIFNLGYAPFYGSEGGTHLNAPIVGMAAAKDGDGYYLVASDGGVFNFGPGAPYEGSKGGDHLNAPIVGTAVDPVTGGYWLVAADGGVFNFGGAPFYGSHGDSPLNKPIVGIGAAPGGGYYLVASDGGIFNYGPGAPYLGSHGDSPLNQPIVGMAVTNDGYYLVASDGGIFNYGPGAPYLGSHGGSPLNQPVVGMAIDPVSGGYWLVAKDGGIFNYGGATLYGSEGSTPLNAPIVGMASSG